MRWYLVGVIVLVALAGCGRGIVQYAQREQWRGDAEVACLKSGTLRQGPGLVRIEPIEGPGICGASHPFKVALLGDGPAFGFADETIRPPGAIPGASTSAQQPRWPIAATRNPPPMPEPIAVASSEPRYASPGPPLSISPPGIDPQAPVPDVAYPYPQRPTYGTAQPAHPQSAPPVAASRPNYAPPRPAIDDEDDPRMRPRVGTPQAYPSAPATPPPALGPQRAPRVTGSVMPVEIKPTATLACPIVSALDHWIAAAVQPSAMRWFGQPVIEIKQISAYSCRGMNGQMGARISEHAFGNALDIAAFVLADGRRITVKGGWQGSPEEQGFMRDVQGAACDQFTTVLAPGSNQFHYDHIHVDLMRRGSGRRICQPGPVDGELIAARARSSPMLAQRQPQAPPARRYDPPFDTRNDPFAWRGDAVRRGDPTTTGSIGPRRGAAKKAASEEDNDWIEDDGPRLPLD